MQLPIILALSILFIPLGTFVLLYFFGKKISSFNDRFAVGGVGLSLVAACSLFIITWNEPASYYTWEWFSMPGLRGQIPFTISILINAPSALMLVVVTFISFFVHLYSIEYMFDKKNYTRYFPYLGLFTAAMVGIVISDNLLVTFIFWELVGFASYLLIGFWMEKVAAAKAAKKAFIVNRIGDAGFIIGLGLLYFQYGTFELSAIQNMLQGINLPNELLFTMLGIGIFLGCMGKSAQFPLQLWLPDAMEGPTPASALIHAATMVAAGIYLLAKTYFLLTPDTLTFVAVVGAITALAGAIPATVQTDIKKVLAFSTISQLGFMVMAMGVGAFHAALFHLVTHAFFKACLFLTAGAVIHEMHHVKRSLFIRGYFYNFDTLNMKLMGGLRTKMPITFLTYFVSAMALIGVPFFSGFLSKDAIMEGTLLWADAKVTASGNVLFYLIPVFAILSIALTAYYMIRQMLLVFFGTFKLKTFYPQAEDAIAKVHDPGWLMKLPMLFLGVFSIWIFFSLNPFAGHHGWLMSYLNYLSPTENPFTLLVPLLSIGAVLLGSGIAWARFNPVNYVIAEDDESTFLKRFFKNNWYMDSIYQFIFVHPLLKLAQGMNLIDRKVIDRGLHIMAYFTVIFAYVVAFFDKYFVDGFVTALSWISKKMGSFIKQFQQGNVQSYYIYTLIIIVFVGIWLFLH